MTTSGAHVLPELLGLDPELVTTLARTCEGAAKVMEERTQGEKSPREAPGPSSLIRWESTEDGSFVGLHLRSDDRRVQSASLLVASAAYWLLLEDPEAARRCYADALGSDVLSADDKLVLSICAGQSAPVGDEPFSAYAISLNRLAMTVGHGASDREPTGEPLPVFSSPVLGIDAQDLFSLSDALAVYDDTAPAERAARSRTARVDAQFRAVLERWSRPIELARLDWRWTEQLGPLLPIEPELLSLSLLYASWSRRNERGILLFDQGVISATLRGAQFLLGTDPEPGLPR